MPPTDPDGRDTLFPHPKSFNATEVIIFPTAAYALTFELAKQPRVTITFLLAEFLAVSKNSLFLSLSLKVIGIVNGLYTKFSSPMV